VKNELKDACIPVSESTTSAKSIMKAVRQKVENEETMTVEEMGRALFLLPASWPVIVLLR
jgi:hypothetical protein